MRQPSVRTFSAALIVICGLGIFVAAQADPPTVKLKNYNPVKKVQINKDTVRGAVNSQASASSVTLPVWNYEVISSRDGNLYDGIIVGQNPADKANPSVTVPGQLVPIILKTHTVGTAVNRTTGVITTVPGDTTFDPTVADACLSAPNNVPIKLMRQSCIIGRRF